MEIFSTANLTVQEAASALGVDAQTVRILIQQKLVPWGECFKLPGSTQYFYMISPIKFYEETGWKKTSDNISKITNEKPISSIEDNLPKIDNKKIE